MTLNYGNCGTLPTTMGNAGFTPSTLGAPLRPGSVYVDAWILRVLTFG